MKTIARLALSLMLCCLIPARAANTWGTDLSDMWWNPNESGWGVNIAHQQEIVFLTLYVYGVDNRVRWYVAPSLPSSVGAFVFSGLLYETTGPYLGGAFNPGAVNNRTVGAVTLNITSISTALLTYTVDGVAVSKSIQRQTFRTPDIGGNYVGAVIGSVSGCVPLTTFAGASEIAISQVGSSMTLASVSSTGLRCTYSGTYTQSGRMGTIVGALSCSNGNVGTFQVYELEASYIGIFARYEASYNSCRESGQIGGMKR
jgi:hypothetical protein